MNTAAQRLALTRQAIIEQVTQGQPRNVTHDSTARPDLHPWRVLREAGQRQWARHPARLVLQLAVPLVAAWARRHPVGLVAITAVVALLLARGRPWRRIRLSALALAALKAAHLPSLVISALAQSPQPPQNRTVR